MKDFSSLDKFVEVLPLTDEEKIAAMQHLELNGEVVVEQLSKDEMNVAANLFEKLGLDSWVEARLTSQRIVKTYISKTFKAH